MIEVMFNDILRQDVDAIVNPANRHMLHGGGLAAIIAGAGGSKLRTASSAKAPIETGEAIVTTAGELPFKAVIHAVGPVWEAEDNFPYWRKNQSSDNADPDELLRLAHWNAIRLASEHELASVAFPAVSCGVFRFPVQRAAPIAIRAVQEAQKAFPKVGLVRFCLLNDEHFEAFSKALSEANVVNAG